MKKIIIAACLVLGILACKKEDTNNKKNTNNNNTIPKATLDMNVNGVEFSTNDAKASYIYNNGSNNGFGFDGKSSDGLTGLSIGTINDIELNKNILVTKNSSIDVIYYNGINSTILTPFRAGGPNSNTKSKFNYRITKIHNPNETIVRCDVDFDGVLYKYNNPNDSVVITNGRLKY